MQLKKDNLHKINAAAEHISIPEEYEFDLPEKVIQFGTGILLRGLPDYFISKANRQKIFNGRIIVVKSTDNGDATAFEKQDDLFVHVFKDIHRYDFFINAAISKVLIAKYEWKRILDCAAQKELQVVISNTTETGIVLDKTDNIHLDPPKSFPGKLLSFLFKRYKIFNKSIENGMVIIPTELIADNAIRLKNIVIELAKINRLEKDFIEWLITANDFCSSLVDRIVVANNQNNEVKFCSDALPVISEAYGLWAIETSFQKTKDILSFSEANEEVIINDDIKKFRKLKIALLNATHSFCCGLALLGGFKFVHESMQNRDFKNFVQQLMLNEIVPCIVDKEISIKEAETFAGTVIHRFSNPYINHEWKAIAFNYTEKIKERCIPLIVKHYKISSELPQKMALGFAAYLCYMKADIKQLLPDKNRRQEDPNNLPGFIEAVNRYINKIEQGNDLSTLIQLEKSLSK